MSALAVGAIVFACQYWADRALLGPYATIDWAAKFPNGQNREASLEIREPYRDKRESRRFSISQPIRSASNLVSIRSLRWRVVAKQPLATATQKP